MTARPEIAAARRVVVKVGSSSLTTLSGGLDAGRLIALVDVLAALRAAGGGPADLVSLTIYIVDMDDYRAHARDIGAVWRRLVGTEYPAMAGIGVARLWDAEALVEVQGIAALPA